MIRNQYGNDTKITKLLKSCTKILCKSSSTVTWAIKFRSFGIEIADLMFKCFPNAKALFLYRNAETWLKSAFKAFLNPDDLNSPEYMDKIQDIMGQFVPLIKQATANNERLS